MRNLTRRSRHFMTRCSRRPLRSSDHENCRGEDGGDGEAREGGDSELLVEQGSADLICSGSPHSWFTYTRRGWPTFVHAVRLQVGHDGAAAEVPPRRSGQDEHLREEVRGA